MQHSVKLGGTKDRLKSIKVPGTTPLVLIERPDYIHSIVIIILHLFI